MWLKKYGKELETLVVESDSEEEITKAEEETVQNSKFKTPEAAAIKLKAKKDLKIIRSQYPHLQINPVPWPSDAEGSAAKKEHKKSEAKTEAKPRSVLTSRKKSSDNTGNQTGSIRSEDPNTDVLIHAAVKDGKKKDTKKQCSRLCSSLCPLVSSTCPLKRRPKRASTEDKENKKAPPSSPSQVPMNNNPEGASSVSSDNMKPDKNNLGGDGPAREGRRTTWTLTRMPCWSTIYLIFNIYYTPTFLLYSSIRSINKNHDYYTG